MDIKHCLEILELEQATSVEEVKQAYRDCVNVWHPDRFTHNPRLTRKAQKKLKEINEAYETLVLFLSGQDRAQTIKTGQRATAEEGVRETWRGGQHSAGRSKRMGQGGPFISRTEAVAEAGTRILLTASSQLIKIFQRWIDTDQV